MRMFKHLPMVTLGVLAAAGSVTAKVLSPRALGKNCDQVTHELQNLRDVLKSTVEKPRINADTLQLLNHAEQAMYKAKSRSSEFLNDVIDSEERLVQEGTPTQISKLKQCTADNSELLDEAKRYSKALRIQVKQLQQPQKTKKASQPVVSIKRQPKASPKASVRAEL